MGTEPPAHCPPGIGAQALDFEALTTTGPLKFADFAPGKWVVFFSHPADVTPVCTTEHAAHARKSDAEEHGTK